MLSARQSDRKCASVAKPTFNSNKAFMGIDYKFGDAQAQAAAARSARKTAVNLIKLSKYFLNRPS
jgi:hypothetical protein